LRKALDDTRVVLLHGDQDGERPRTLAPTHPRRGARNDEALERPSALVHTCVNSGLRRCRIRTHAQRNRAMNRAIERELRQQLERLAPEQQRQVLDFARALPAPIIPGASGEVTVRFAGTIPKDDLAIISKAIEKGCERVNPGEW